MMPVWYASNFLVLGSKIHNDNILYRLKRYSVACDDTILNGKLEYVVISSSTWNSAPHSNWLAVNMLCSMKSYWPYHVTCFVHQLRTVYYSLCSSPNMMHPGTLVWSCDQIKWSHIERCGRKVLWFSNRTILFILEIIELKGKEWCSKTFIEIDTLEVKAFFRGGIFHITSCSDSAMLIRFNRFSFRAAFSPLIQFLYCWN